MAYRHREILHFIQKRVLSVICLDDTKFIPGWKGPCRLVEAVQNFALFSGFGGCMRLPLNRTPGCMVAISVIEYKKNETMTFRWCTMFAAALDQGHFSLGAKGSNTRRVEATSWFFYFSIEPEMNGLGQYRAVSHSNSQAITMHSLQNIHACSQVFSTRVTPIHPQCGLYHYSWL